MDTKGSGSPLVSFTVPRTCASPQSGSSRTRIRVQVLVSMGDFFGKGRNGWGNGGIVGGDALAALQFGDWVVSCGLALPFSVIAV
jgi:hypothetical protein